MRVHRSPGSPAQPRREAEIKRSTISSIRPMPPGQAVEDAGLALVAMGDEGVDMRLRLGDRRTVGRPIDRVAAPSSLSSEAI